jgi:cytochrome P450
VSVVSSAPVTTSAETATTSCPHADLGAAFAPFDLSDPFPFYERAREEAAVFYSPEIDFWVVTRYDDIQSIFKDPATFSSENTQSPFRERPAEVQQVLDAGGMTGFSGLSARQPPDHTRLKAFVTKAFTPKRVALLEPWIRELAGIKIGAMATKGRADWVADVAYELPALVIFHMLGIPAEDVADVKRWAQSRVYLNFGDLPVAEQVEHAENLVRYWRYCEDLVERRFAHPQDDLTGELVRIYQDGDRSITKHEIASLVYGQLTAGHETTSNLLAGGVLELLRRRATWNEICEDTSLIPAAVEELLRLAPSVIAWKRKTKKPVQIAGVDLPEGANVLLLLGSANRDTRHFEQPDQLDLKRANSRDHLSLGLGIHFCLGASLTRLEARVVLEELTTRLPEARLVEPQSFEFAANSTFRGPANVWLEWDGAP